MRHGLKNHLKMIPLIWLASRMPKRKLSPKSNGGHHIHKIVKEPGKFSLRHHTPFDCLAATSSSQQQTLNMQSRGQPLSATS